MKKLLMTTCAILALAGNAYADEAHCGSPRVFFGEDLRDTNPTVGVNITYNPDTHNWQVFHHLYNGMVASRSQQYAITDWSSDMYGSRWTGSLNRNRALHMVGTLSQNGFYEEKLFDRNLGDRMVMHLGVQCRLVYAVAPSDPVLVAPAPRPVPVAPPVVAAPAPVAPAPAPVQQSGAPVVVTVPIIVPPSYAQQPAPQAPATVQAPAVQAPAVSVLAPAPAPKAETPAPTASQPAAPSPPMPAAKKDDGSV
jgi:hypothetical protein